MTTKTPISDSKSYQEIGKFWDEHDADEFGGQEEVEFFVNIQLQRRYYSLDQNLSIKLRNIARSKGLTEQALLNSWVQEKVNQNIDIAR
jgi:hypothetical protein